MLIKRRTVQLSGGLQARHTALFAREACSFQSDIFIAKDGKCVSGKSIMKIMALAVKKGDEITLLINGVDEHAAARTLEEFLLTKHK
ncbi:HPr family phosphocarrier protein [Priestia megaterium]|uniref:HPr family phosphocarrier protein n=1 Tax=Priestia megaterium TaxID=1404 RepID=UPI0013E3A54F|nr:HPr family phosphocarrier protein [Priestia megaterium]MED3866038.1 HPr family phosphocarrier protein [Priestia megaterium]MED4101707.1 HPr family phosphocarrier protein [Priestia megaterium]MED4145706.1 HPr family phosphocarrier protein [Priestia megaterium]MED4166449.1 HPr family phosphocarrier protein [Priestia megaterium]MED4199639.1 HPr family phosphocarrier protein [Priestia megaterium]